MRSLRASIKVMKFLGAIGIGYQGRNEELYLCRLSDPFSGLRTCFTRVLNSRWNPDLEAVKRRGKIHLRGSRRYELDDREWVTENGISYPVSTHELLNTRHIITDKLEHG